MGAVVSGTTHGVLSAILIVYEMTNDYRIILPIMIAAGLSSVVARLIDRESIYHKKLSRRGQSVARGHDLTALEHIMARDLMVRRFPTIKHTDTLTEIIRVARENPQFESLPVMDAEGKLRGIIRPEDLHRVVDSDLPPQLVFADDIALHSAISIAPDENMLEVLRDFGTRDVETLPVVVGTGGSRRLVGLLLRSDVMRCYREELLRNS
jgi:CIC family chloride channel protein